MGNIFFNITVIICLATVTAIIFRFLKQPPILAYILSGVVLGHISFFTSSDKELLQSLADIGITLLLFILGLEFKLSGLKSIGKAAVVTGIGQIGLTFFVGLSLSLVFGLTLIESSFIGLALTFSSTIIIIKILSDKKDLSSLHGKITVGILLIQDFLAIFVLIVLSSFHHNMLTAFSPVILSVVLLKVFLLFTAIFLLNQHVFPRIVSNIARSPEILFLFSLAWVFGLAAFVSSPLINFPISVGGFLGGLALANAVENYQIAARIRGLRDFFITIFFVTLGISMSFTKIGEVVIPAIVLSGVVLFLKPLIALCLAAFFGYRKRTTFLLGISLAQISEFSLIIVFLGKEMGYVSDTVVSLITVVAIVTFTLSTYMMLHSNWLYKLFLPILNNLELASENVNKHELSPQDLENLEKHVTVIGGQEMGKSIVAALKDEGEVVLVVDFDPDIVKALHTKGVKSIFGDITDIDIQERARLHKAKLIISTVPDLEDNLSLIKILNKENKRAKIIVMAREKHEVKTLYKAGADYVVMPYLAGGRHLAKIITDDKLEVIEEYKKKDLRDLH